MQNSRQFRIRNSSIVSLREVAKVAPGGIDASASHHFTKDHPLQVNNGKPADSRSFINSLFTSVNVAIEVN